MCPSSSTWSAAPILLKIWPLRSSSACSAWFQAGTRLPPCAICVPGLPGIGSTTGWPLCPARPGWPLVGGGTIPDTGQYPVFLGTDGPRLGELDEEFVFERRVGEAFALGNNTWRIEAIEAHRVVVRPAEGNPAVMPFWRGENAPRCAELGAAVGALCREIAGRLDDPELPRWLEENCRLEARATEPLIRYIARQARIAGVVPDDQTILVETFRDPAGELGLAVLSPFGGKIHQGLKLALLGRIRDRLGIQASCLHGDDGLLIRLPGMDDPPLDLLEGLTADEAERLIRLELPQTALYGLRFRQNAARALLMPRPDPGKRTPLWLQRLRAKDLLQVVGKLPDFPIVVETFRECLDQDLELSRLRRLLDAIGTGSVRIATRQGEIASPFASELIFQFTPTYLYEWDEPRRADLRAGGPAVDEDLLDALLESPQGARLLDPQALGRVESRLRRRGMAPRTVDEMAEMLRAIGDLACSELFGPMEHFLDKLSADGRAIHLELPGTAEPLRWILTEDEPRYRSAFAAHDEPDMEALGTIVRQYLHTHALIGLAEICRRYPIAPEVATELLDQWVGTGGLIRLEPAGADTEAGCRWAEPENLAEVHRLSLAIRRRESVAVAPEVFVDFLLRRQRLHPATRLEGPAALEAALEQLQGYAATAELWESELLPRRLKGYQAAWLDDLLATGSWLWRAGSEGKDEPFVALVPREFEGRWPCQNAEVEKSADERLVLEILRSRGASFATDLARVSGLEPSRLRRALRGLDAPRRGDQRSLSPRAPGRLRDDRRPGGGTDIRRRPTTPGPPPEGQYRPY